MTLCTWSVDLGFKHLPGPGTQKGHLWETYWGPVGIGQSSQRSYYGNTGLVCLNNFVGEPWGQHPEEREKRGPQKQPGGSGWGNPPSWWGSCLTRGQHPGTVMSQSPGVWVGTNLMTTWEARHQKGRPALRRLERTFVQHWVNLGQKEGPGAKVRHE